MAVLLPLSPIFNLRKDFLTFEMYFERVADFLVHL